MTIATSTQQEVSSNKQTDPINNLGNVRNLRPQDRDIQRAGVVAASMEYLSSEEDMLAVQRPSSWALFLLKNHGAAC